MSILLSAHNHFGISKPFYFTFFCFCIILLSGCTGTTLKAPEIYCNTDKGQTAKEAWLHTDSAFYASGKFNPGITANRWWVKTKITNPLPHPANFVLLPNNPHINRMKVYLDGADTPAYVMGDFFPFAQRPLKDRDLAIPLTLPAQGHRDVLLWVDKPGETLLLELAVWKDDDLSTMRQEESLLMGFLTGWLGLIFIFGILYWYQLKKISGLLYATYIFTVFLWIISHWGLGFQYLWPEATGWATKSRPVFNLLCNSSFMAVVIAFFPPLKGMQRLAWVIKGFILIQLGLALAFMQYNDADVPVATKMFFLYINIILSLLMVMAILYYLILQWRAGTAQVGLYLLGIGFLMVITILLQIDQSGLSFGIPAALYNFGSGIGLIGETAFITIGFARNAAAYKNEKEQLVLKVLQQEKQMAEQEIEIQVETLKHISQEMHDNIGQQLGLMKLQLYQLEQQGDANFIQAIKETLRNTLSDLRELSKALHPEKVGATPLHISIQNELNKVAKSTTIEIETSLTQNDSLDALTRITFFRVFQELLHNALKHSDATKLNVQLRQEGNRWQLNVADNGKGMDSGDPVGLGLTSIKNRLQMLNGTMEIQANNGGGTIVCISVNTR